MDSSLASPHLVAKTSSQGRFLYKLKLRTKKEKNSMPPGWVIYLVGALIMGLGGFVIYIGSRADGIVASAPDLVTVRQG